MRSTCGLFSRPSENISCMPSVVKYELYLTEVRFLGHVVSASSVSVDLEKVETVMSWERPKSVLRYAVS